MALVLPLRKQWIGHETYRIEDAHGRHIGLAYIPTDADAIVAAVNERAQLSDDLQASQVAEQMARDDVRGLKREVEGLRVAADAWCTYALHMEWCAECSQGSPSACYNGGRELYQAAHSYDVLHPQASERGA